MVDIRHFQRVLVFTECPCYLRLCPFPPITILNPPVVVCVLEERLSLGTEVKPAKLSYAILLLRRDKLAKLEP